MKLLSNPEIMLKKLFIKNFVIILLLLFNMSSVHSQLLEYPIQPDKVEHVKKLQKSYEYIESFSLETDDPVKIMVLLIAIPGHPTFSDEWPLIKNHSDYPNESYPILGTFPDETLLRTYLNDDHTGPINVEDWYKNQIEEYYKINSGGKFEVEVLFPKTPDGKVYSTTRKYYEWIKLNNGEKAGMVSKYNNWKKMGGDVISKVYRDNNSAFEGVKLINFVYLVYGDEYSPENYSAFSYDIPHAFKSGRHEIYNGHVITTYKLKVLLHETFHRIGSIVGDPLGFEGLPDRTTLPFFEAPHNMTWGHDIMYNKGHFPSENALWGAPPMLTMDRIFFEWIEPYEVLIINKADKKNIKLVDVNHSLTDEEVSGNYYRAVKVMIHEDFSGSLDEYFLVEFRNGTDFDRNFYNIYEPEPHKGILIWHVKENTKLINRRRDDDHFYDLELAVPYNGWHGNPIPRDNFPRDYNRPYSWFNDMNMAGDFDYLDDNSSNPPFPDGGVHRWELTDFSHTEWAPFYVRRNTLRSNFFTDDTIRGNVSDKLSNYTRPSSKDWEGRPTYITIENIKRVDGYMTFDVKYENGILPVDNDYSTSPVYKLENNYPNPFNPQTKIEYSLADDSHVTVRITNVAGEVIQTLVSKNMSRGKHVVEFYGENFPSGVYFYTIQADNYIDTKSMLLLK